MKKVIFIDFWNKCPHLETTFELIKKHLDSGDKVHFFFLGHTLPYKEGIKYSWRKYFCPILLPERMFCKKFDNNNQFFFCDDLELTKVKWTVPLSFNSLADLSKVSYKNADLGLGVLSSLIFKTNTCNPNFKKYRKLIRRMLLSSAISYETAMDILRTHSPDLLYLFNGRFCHHRAVMNAAIQLNIKTLFHERGANKNRYWVGEQMPHHSEYRQEEMMDFWNNSDSDLDRVNHGKRFFVDRRRGHEQGWKSFTKRQRSGELPDFPRDKRLITYFSSSEDEIAAIGDIIKWDRWENQKAAVNDLVAICKDLESIFLVIRLHPNEATKHTRDNAYWHNLSKKNHILVIDPADNIDSYALIERSEIVITCNSTIGIEAVFWGKPSISLGPSFYSSLKATYQPSDKNELRKILSSKSLEVDPASALPFGFYQQNFGILYKFYKSSNLFRGEFMGLNPHRNIFYLFLLIIFEKIFSLFVKNNSSSN